MITAYDTTGTQLWQIYSFIKNTPFCSTRAVRERELFGLNEIKTSSTNYIVGELLRADLIKECYPNNKRSYIINYPAKTEPQVKSLINSIRGWNRHEVELAKSKARRLVKERQYVNWNNVAMY